MPTYSSLARAPLKRARCCRKDLGIEKYVHFLGVRDDVPKIMAFLDLFMFPSLYEGLGIAVIEAQAAGIPIIASEAIPPEADLHFGLLHRPLAAGFKVWSDTATSLLRKAPVPEWDVRRRALTRSGYDIRTLANCLQRIYLGAGV